jgi:DNA-binding NarL/FixJ family response regulator
MINILIADDHRLMREGLRKILHGVPDIKIAGLACDAMTTLSAIAATHIDVLLLDLSMPGIHGIELITQVRTRAPHTKILVLTMHDESQYAVRSIRAGAMGFLTKESASAGTLLEAIRSVAAGRPVVSASAAKLLAMHLIDPCDSSSSFSKLSLREQEVFMMLVEGGTLTSISRELGLSIKTISTFKTRIERKMQLTGVSELVQYALKHKLTRTHPQLAAGASVTSTAPQLRSVAAPSSATFMERRQCRLTESKVNVALILLDMLGGEDATKYLASARVPREVAARVVTHPRRCRNAHQLSLKAELNENPTSGALTADGPRG